MGSQQGIMLAISALVGIACGGLLWFGADLTSKLHAAFLTWRAKRAPKSEAKTEETEAGGARAE